MSFLKSQFDDEFEKEIIPKLKEQFAQWMRELVEGTYVALMDVSGKSEQDDPKS